MKTTRRQFLKITAVTSGTLAGSGIFLKDLYAVNDEIHPDPAYDDTTVKVLRTACMMCNAGCGIQVRVKNGQALKIEGNPYCPHTNDYNASGTTVVASDIPDPDHNPGRICARGNGGLATVYSPYRLMTPLKRVGPRGSGRFEAISWKQVFDELVNGGVLPNAYGTGTYNFEGLLAIRGDPAPYAPASGNIDASDTRFGSEAKGGDPKNFGRKANRYVWIRGRDQIDQITKRFNDSYGTVNHIEHSSLCNTAWAKGMNHTFFSWHDGAYKYMRAELTYVNYLVLLGTNPAEANVGTPYWIRKLTDLKASGGKIIYVDPFYTPTAKLADRWIPITPGTDMAFVFGMLRHLIDNGKIDAQYLKVTGPHLLGSTYKNWTGASYLVKIENGQEEGFLTDKEAGLGVLTTLYEAITDKKASTIKVRDASALPDSGVILIGSEFIYYAQKTNKGDYWELGGCKRGIDSSAAFAPLDAEVLVPYIVRAGGGFKRYFEVAPLDEVDEEFEGEVNGHEVMTAWALLLEETKKKTVGEWAQVCGVEESVIREVASEFVKEGNRSCLEAYRGAFGQTNGQMTQALVNIFNAVTGRVDRIGGYCTSKRFGVKEPARAVDTKGDDSVKLTSGVRIDRAGSKYEGTNPTPSRMWYPLAPVVAQEAIVSAAEGYPYKCKALSFYCHDPAYTTPNNAPVIEALLKHDENGEYAIPLVFSYTLFLDETAALSDYVLPDSSYLERFSWPFTGYPTVKTKSATIRRPVIGSYKDIMIEGRPARIYIPAFAKLEGNTFDTVDDLIQAWSGPMPYDEFLVQLAKKLQLPNFGRDEVATGKPGQHIDTAYQFWDLACKAGDFPNGLDNEGKDGLPGSFDTPGGYMDMGGKWENPAEIEDPSAPGWCKVRYGSCIQIFREKNVHYKNPYTGRSYPGIPRWEEPLTGIKGTKYSIGQGDFWCITGKRAWHVQSRSTNNQWLLEIEPENFLLMNPSDASKNALQTGDKVRVISASYPEGVLARVRVTPTLPPGTTQLYFHFGRKWFGSVPIYIDGSATEFDKAVGAGTPPNPVMLGDPDFPELPFTDQLSGQAVYVGRITVARI
jgi:tetrathionate reductase subunit A